MPALRGGGNIHILVCTGPASLLVNPCDVPELPFITKYVFFYKALTVFYALCLH